MLRKSIVTVTKLATPQRAFHQKFTNKFSATSNRDAIRGQANAVKPQQVQHMEPNMAPAQK